MRGRDALHADPVARDVALLELTRRFSRVGVLITFLYRGDRVSITDLRVVGRSLRGRGLARRALGEVCRWADEYGFVLGISPTGEFGADLYRLRAFYGKHGFVDDAASAPDAMRRPPRPAWIVAGGERVTVGDEVVTEFHPDEVGVITGASSDFGLPEVTIVSGPDKGIVRGSLHPGQILRRRQGKRLSTKPEGR